ncbi:hypothetical protein J3458_004582 [Metarhizium acridum]|uniref:uncharacterized protein n=1 Tax=Metarhizium acridum TaxID=92637 RepID=UPI001C6B45F6|nr:hypothetical protein J3458_004582 [Metarhizium acridum]
MQQGHAYGLPCRVTKPYNKTRRDENIRYMQSYDDKDKTALSGTLGSTHTDSSIHDSYDISRTDKRDMLMKHYCMKKLALHHHITTSLLLFSFLFSSSWPITLAALQFWFLWCGVLWLAAVFSFFPFLAHWVT